VAVRPDGRRNDLIVNRASGLVLTDPNFSTDTGVDIQQNQIDNGPNQEWQVNIQPDGYFQLLNQNSNMDLDDDNSSSNGSPVVQWPFTGSSNQQWAIVQAGNGPAWTSIVTNRQSGLPLYDSGQGNGGYVRQYYPGDNSLSDQWTFVPLADGSYVILNAGDGLVLTENESGYYADVYQWEALRTRNGISTAGL
jgi:hypothetical protein